MKLIVDWERILLVKYIHYIHTIGYYTILHITPPMLTHAYTDRNSDTDTILIFTVLYYIMQYFTSTILVAVLIPY